jgi:DNA-binding CsgD family transcriptional regulator
MGGRISVKPRLGVIELLSFIGFAFALCSGLSTLFGYSEASIVAFGLAGTLAVRSLFFCGLIFGHLLLRFMPAAWRSHAFRAAPLAAITLLYVAAPVQMLAHAMGAPLHFVLASLTQLSAGIGFAWFTLSWLDIGERARISDVKLYASCAFIVAGLLLTLFMVVAEAAQPVFSIFCTALNIVLLVSVGTRFQLNATLVLPRSEFLYRMREIEPPIFLLSVAFGMAFAYIFSTGVLAVPTIALAMIVGAGGALASSLLLRGRVENIVAVLRVAACVTVVALLAFPLLPAQGRYWLAAAEIAAWAFFSALNYAILVQRAKSRGLFAFWNISACMLPKTTGELAGWMLAGALAAGYFTVSLQLLASILVTLLVLSIFIFWPSPERHNSWNDASARHAGTDASATAGAHTSAAAQAAGLGSQYGQASASIQANASAAEAEPLRTLIEEHCAQIAKASKLSKREREVLVYLARGRNTAYIQRKLAVSHNTAKTHVRNVYHKLAVHSQQEAIDYVETFGRTN